jgi:hypothetical protein
MHVTLTLRFPYSLGITVPRYDTYCIYYLFIQFLAYNKKIRQGNDASLSSPYVPRHWAVGTPRVLRRDADGSAFSF